MKINSVRINRFIGGLTAAAIRTWMGTLDCRVAYYTPRSEPLEQAERFLYLQWHEYIPFMLHLRGRTRATLMVSRHRDGEHLTQALHRFGFRTVRGSTRKGAASALRKMLAKRSGHLVMTPDGPQGPRRRVQAGAIYLASKLGLRIVCMGQGYDRPWRLGSWDRFALPRPYSRARLVLSPPLEVPADLDREGIEQHRQWVEWILNRLTLEAEAWAAAGSAKYQELPMLINRVPERFGKLLRHTDSLSLGTVHRAAA